MKLGTAEWQPARDSTARAKVSISSCKYCTVWMRQKSRTVTFLDKRSNCCTYINKMV